MTQHGIDDHYVHLADILRVATALEHLHGDDGNEHDEPEGAFVRLMKALSGSKGIAADMTARLAVNTWLRAEGHVPGGTEVAV